MILGKAVRHKYNNLSIVTLSNENWTDFSAFSYHEFIISKENKHLDLRVDFINDKRMKRHYIKALSFIYGDIKESLMIPHRIALDYQAVRNCHRFYANNDNILNDKLHDLCDKLGLEFYGNSVGRWIRLVA